MAISNVSDRAEAALSNLRTQSGLEIAQQINEEAGYAILLVYRAQALHLIIIKRIMQNLIAKTSMGSLDIGSFVGIEADKRIKELTEELTKISLDVRNAFKILIDSDSYFILTYLLTVSLDMTGFAIQLLSRILGKEKFQDEIEEKDFLAQRLINFIKVFEDEELELAIRDSVALYYYYTRGGKAGLKIIEPALIIAEEREDQLKIERFNSMINLFKTEPDPYNTETRKVEDLSIKELTESVKEHIEFLGEDLSDGSDTSNALNLGLNDMDPESYLKFCEELYIHYTSTSALGEAFGVPSIGYKLLWCKHSKVTIDYHLDAGFETHKERYCKDCKHRKPRPEDWVCTVGWFWGREVPKPIHEFLENMNKW